MVRTATACLLCLIASACAPLGPRITFPDKPLNRTSAETWYDADRDGRGDFALHYDREARVDELWYDDDEDGVPDRTYRLADDADRQVPHLIVLLDSVPFALARERWDAGDLRWFNPPIRVIPPFPTLTEVCYTVLLHAPPLEGMVDQSYNPRTHKRRNGMWDRSMGTRLPWERRLSYRAPYLEAAFTYMDPRGWLPVEMGRIREALAKSPDRVTIVYAVTASGMTCKYGRTGIEKTLDAARQLCLQLLYERRGAIRISLMADHGHNLTESRTASKSIRRAIKAGGFRVAETLARPGDVVIELAALVNYVGLRTADPAAVATAALHAPEVELAAYRSGQSVMVRDARGSAALDYRDGALRYRMVDHDVLGYGPVIGQLRRQGKMSTDGFAADRDWFEATVEHNYPDAPRRLWDAFGGLVTSPPDVMLTLKDGFHAGSAAMEHFIRMKSTHGSLDQRNSATFLMTMGPALPAKAIRLEDVLPALEPGFEPRVRE